jgi:hypothetical protein
MQRAVLRKCFLVGATTHWSTTNNKKAYWIANASNLHWFWCQMPVNARMFCNLWCLFHLNWKTLFMWSVAQKRV